MFNREVIRTLGLITQVGLSMVTPILLCVFFGVKLNQYFHTQHWFVPMLLMGIGAGIRNVYLLIYKKDNQTRGQQGELIDDEMEKNQ